MLAFVRAKRSTRLPAVVAVVALAVHACGDDGGASSRSTDAASAGASVPANGEVVEVLTLDNNFRPEDVEIAAGTTVRWNNGGRNDHDIVPVVDTQDWGVDITNFVPGDVYEHVFTTPGTYAYYCTLHGTATAGMIGSVVVTG